MPKDYTAQPLHAVRRTDRQVEDDAWIVDFLSRAAFGALATVYDGQPFINSNLFVYDPAAHAIYTHTARTGRTRANIDAMPGGIPVCFSVSEMGRLLPADEALEFSVEYAGVTVFGQAEVVTGEEARDGLQKLLDKYAPHLHPGRDYRPIQDDELARTSVFRIRVEAWSGKRKQVAEDFPGAFWYAG
jgi:nitroimidazol reductase NimA-like FMN-containing flavoprotein (pyridoxamine 5'-phosphate oxidase superfamily)